jgi:hypothetical protein
MADNVTLPPTGTGTATPVVATKDIGGQHYERIMAGPPIRIAQTPTISTGIYAAGDAVGGLLTFTGAARYSGGGGIIQSVAILDLDQERAPLELVLFNQSFTNSADNAAFDPSDADLANIVAVIPISQWFNFFDNAVGVAANLAVPFQLAGTANLFGQLVTRGTPTYTATSDISVILGIIQE